MKYPGQLAKADDQLADAAGEHGTHSRAAARLALYARLLLSDAVSIFIAFSIAEKVRGDKWVAANGVSLLLLILPLFILIAANNRAYSLNVLRDFSESVRRTVTSVIVTFLVLATTLFATQSAEDISRLAIGVAFSTILICTVVFRYLSYRWVKNALDGTLFDELLIIDGHAPENVRASSTVDAALNNLRPDLDDSSMVERFAQIVRFYDRVVVSCPAERENNWAILLKSADVRGEILVAERRDLGVLGLDTFGAFGTLVVSRGAFGFFDRLKKRIFDLVIATIGIIFLAPLIIAVALIIKIDSPGPVFFRQARIGRQNIPFQIYKFRSMRHEASDAAGDRSTGRTDDRISRFGHFIRRTSIDEIPQLFNVIRGEMSIVGPRPHAFGSKAEDQLFWEISHRYWERHALQPGITGLAQIRGFRGTTEKTSDLVHRLQADLEYLEGWGLWRDVIIIFATLKVLVHPNAY